jgi:hypothetical protein
METQKQKETDTMVSLPIIGSLTYREWHGLIDGVYAGVQNLYQHDYQQEKHYWRVGWLLGDAYDRYLREGEE